MTFGRHCVRVAVVSTITLKNKKSSYFTFYVLHFAVLATLGPCLLKDFSFNFTGQNNEHS